MSFRITLITTGLLGAIVSSDPAKDPAERPITPKDRGHWSFQPMSRTAPPLVRDAATLRSPIDTFLQQRLEKEGLIPAREAARAVWLRRVTFDLTGLNPTPQELDDFEADRSPCAEERVVDRLLASPHYGERRAQFWLDLVRYADSNGYEVDGDRPHAWRYRDYVVRSFGDDKPFRRFILEQLAGDELVDGKDTKQQSELLIATGMHRCGPIHLVSGNIDPAVARQEVLTEIVQGVGSAFLGLTVQCARCHDHKFDPVSQADYYRMEAFFAPVKFRDIDLADAAETERFRKETADVLARTGPLKTKIEGIDARYRPKIREAKKAKLEPVYRDALSADPKTRTDRQKELAKEAETLLKVTWDEVVAALTPQDRAIRESLRAELHEWEARLPALPAAAWAMKIEDKSAVTHVLKRGEVGSKGAIVQSGFPRVLAGSPPADGVGSRRKLAEWLADVEHPLTYRVYVNRIWKQFFGSGLVDTANDFGLKGNPPTHPELLDWLARRLIEDDGRTKSLIRTIVLSAAYRRTSEVDPKSDAVRKDPTNRLLSRMNRKRMEGETIRDAALSAAGTLFRKLGGPGVRPPLEPEVYDLIFTEGEPDGLWRITPDARYHGVRSLYLFAKRNVRYPLFEAFDQPDRLSPCGDRGVSTYAPQSLIMMNGPVMQELSQSAAVRAIQVGAGGADDSIRAAYRLILARRPTDGETELVRRFLDRRRDSIRDRISARLPVRIPVDLASGIDLVEAAAVADLCLALMNSTEFAYID